MSSGVVAVGVGGVEADWLDAAAARHRRMETIRNTNLLYQRSQPGGTLKKEAPQTFSEVLTSFFTEPDHS